MYEAFLSLKAEKQKTIINAAMTEFVKGGYEKASINDIVTAAGISKGSIFYYFKNKKYLFLYLFQYGEELIEEEFCRVLQMGERDLLSRIGNMMHGNVFLLNTHPLVFEFVRIAKQEKSEAVASEITRIKDASMEGLQAKLMSDIDESLFKDAVNVHQAIFVITATLEKLVNQFIIDEAYSMEEVEDQTQNYLDFFRSVFYKETE